MNELDLLYVMKCPQCGRKCGMMISDQQLRIYKEIGAKIGCPYCGNPYPISEPYLHRGEVEEVVSPDLKG